MSDETQAQKGKGSGVQTLATGPDDDDIRLDRWLRRQFPQLTQAAIQKWCRTGQVRVDGKRVDTNHRLQPGQFVRVPPVPAAPPERKKLGHQISADDQRMLEQIVLYRDDHLIVINKPPGLPTQGGPNITRHLDGMLDGLRFDAKDRPKLVHRLDRDTSGVLVLARTTPAARKLAALFRGRDITKIYWAIVAGRPVPVEGVIDLPIRKTGITGIMEPADRRDPDGANAITEYQTLDHAARKLAWLELSPRTGRTHQLRVHCAALQAPILGDDKYGEEKSFVEGLPHQLHLHARTLIFPHPAGGTLRVSAPLPKHMNDSFKLLGFAVQKTPKPSLI